MVSAIVFATYYQSIGIKAAPFSAEVTCSVAYYTVDYYVNSIPLKFHHSLIVANYAMFHVNKVN